MGLDRSGLDTNFHFHIIEEPRSPGMGGTVNRGGPGTDPGGMGYKVPILPTFQQHRQSAGAATSMQVDVDTSRVSRIQGGLLPGNGTQLDSDFYADAREKDSGPDRRDSPWSPDAGLMDTVARLQRDLDDMRTESRYLRLTCPGRDPLMSTWTQLLPGMFPWCWIAFQYRMTSYDPAEVADVDPAHGLQRHHPRFLEYVGAPESAGLLSRPPAHWIETMDHEEAVSAALKLQHDAGLIMSNLQVFGQFVNRMSSEVMRLAFGQEQFPSVAIQAISPLPHIRRAAHYMAAMGLWRPPGCPGTPGPVPTSSCNNSMQCINCFPTMDK